MNVPQFIFPFYHLWAHVLLPVRDIMNNVTLNTYIYFGAHVYWIYLPGAKLLGSGKCTCLALVENTKNFTW